MRNGKIFWKRGGAVLMMMAMLCFPGCAADPIPETTSGSTAESVQKENKPVNFDLEKDVLFFGRTYKKANIQWFNWSGSGFSVRFKGGSVAAEVYSNAPDVRELAYLKVYVDGVEQKDILLKEDCQIVMLAEGLDPAQEHTVEVRKRTNARSSTAGIGRLVLMDGTILEPVAPKERLIEFIGDSLTVGYVAAKDGKTATAWSTTTEDVTKTYCPQIAQAFDAEYAAHGFGGEYKGKKLGTIGHFGAYSFHEVKNMTSFGEGGILTTTIKEFRPEMKRARFLGADFSKQIKNWLYDVCAIPGKDGSSFVATNFSTTEIQGLGLQLQLSRYDKILEDRAQAAAYLTNRLSGCDAIKAQDLGNEDIKPTFHLYSVIIDPEKAGGDVQLFKKKLAQKGVTEIAHFGPLYRFEVLKDRGYDEAAIAATCPVTEEVFDRRFTHFPIYGLTKEQLDYMADAILESIDEMQKGI